MDDGFQFFDIILFAMIAAFLVLRLRGVLGRRDGHKGGRPDPFTPDRDSEQNEDTVVHLPDRSSLEAESGTPGTGGRPEDSLEAGLMDIRNVDPRFDRKEFTSGARIAFELILSAYAEGNTKTLKSMLSPEVYGNFARSIGDRERAGETLEDTLVGISTIDIVEAYMEDHTAFITAKLISDQINATRDENGDVVDGDPNAVIEVTDFWTFSHDTQTRDPNWTLVATRSLD